MALVHIALGALSSIFGAHLSWAATGWIMERRRRGETVFWPAVLCASVVLGTAVALVVVLMSADGIPN